MEMSRGRIARFLLCLLVILSTMLRPTVEHAQSRKTINTDAEFLSAMKELSNWGRWGKDDQLGAANLITPTKRRQAAALVKEGRTVSLGHDVPREPAADGESVVKQDVLIISPGASVDRYQWTGTYHGAAESHLDSLMCHTLFQGSGYNGFKYDEVTKEHGCPRGDILALKDGVVTRGVLFDATLLSGKAPHGWLEPGTAIHGADLEALEKAENIKVSAGDVILLYTGRWKRRRAVGPWSTKEGFGGYHADIAYFLKERGVSFIAADMAQDVSPNDFKAAEGFPVHRLAIVAMGVSAFDNLDLEEAAGVARTLKRWEFLFTAAPLRVEHGMGSPINPLAIF